MIKIWYILYSNKIFHTNSLIFVSFCKIVGPCKRIQHIAAVELYTKSIKNDRYFALAYNARGVSKLHLKDYRGALIDFNKAIILQPEYGEAYFYRGLSKSYLSDNVAACTDAKQAEKLGYDSKKLISAVCIEAKP